MSPAGCRNALRGVAGFAHASFHVCYYVDCIPSFVSTSGMVVPDWNEVLRCILIELGWRHPPRHLQVAPGKEGLDMADATANMHHHNGDGYGLVQDVLIIRPKLRSKVRNAVAQKQRAMLWKT